VVERRAERRTELDLLLAHGRGAGWLAAVELGSPAIDSLLRCVVEDPRWDRQVESRDDYYASLWLVLDADPRRIVDALTTRDPDDVRLARDVLIQLAWRGHADALAAVVARVEAGAETDAELELVGGMAFAQQVYALAGRTIAPVELETRKPTLALDPDIDLEGLVAIARSTNDPRQPLAARQLGALGHAGLIAEAEAFLRSECGLPHAERSGHRQRRAWLAHLDALPAALTLERARSWFHAPWPLSLAGERILIRHAEPDDRPMLEQAGALALAEHAIYRLCSIIDALAGLEAPESIALLRTIHCTIDYSYARERVIEALLAHAERAEVQALLVESLWDCESGTRSLACEGVDPHASEARLQAIEVDAFERESVRAAARAALAGPGV
jgi:hypothetical protein